MCFDANFWCISLDATQQGRMHFFMHSKKNKKMLVSSQSGLPDGIFSNQKSKFG
jgi:hypothetical protein